MVRRITTLDQNGTPARQLSFEEVRHGVLQRAGVEFQLYEKRPLRVVCTGAGCGAIVKVPRTGKVPEKCRACRRKDKYGAHTEQQRFAYLQKMAKIVFYKKLPGWVARKEFIKRYGEAPPLEWLVKVGLRKEEAASCSQFSNELENGSAPSGPAEETATPPVAVRTESKATP